MRKSALIPLSALASLKLTLLGMVALLAAILQAYLSRDPSSPWIMAAVSVLALNLLAAIVFNPRIRRNSGLLMFHICLLMIAVLSLLSELTSMQGRVEVVQGTAFDASGVTVTEQGAWHRSARLQQLHFVQGAIEVDYAEGLRRGPTRSRVQTDEGAVVVGDTVPFEQNGYRFYTTSNKGYAAMINWYAKGGSVVRGSINFPSFPLYDWKQHNQWQTPGGERLEFTLLIDTPLDRARAWSLRGVDQGRLEISLPGGGSRTLAPGGHVVLANGVLEFEAIRMWMGYRIFYDPLLAWFLAVALVGVSGLAWHYYLRLSAPASRCVPVRGNRRRGADVATTQS